MEGDVGSNLRGRGRTPRAELARLHQRQLEQDFAVRERIMEAILRACGEQGYRNVSVQDVIERYGGYRVQFYRHFANKADAYAAAYETTVERLCAAILGAAQSPPAWPAGMRAALDVLARFAAERPELARGLIVEVHVAGGRALAKRGEICDRLARAIDTARRESVCKKPPPPIAAAFLVGAIEAAAASALTASEPERFAEAVPELAEIADNVYFGGTAGRRPATIPAG